MSHETIDIFPRPQSAMGTEQDLLGAPIAGSATLADLPPRFESAWFADDNEPAEAIPAIGLLPPDGVHPVMPARGAMQ